MVKYKMTLNELQHEAHKIAKEKGWYDNGPRPHLEIHALFHSEIAEATEEVRAGHDTIYFDGDKPLGPQIELADLIIRVADHFEANQWDLETTVQLKMAYNKKRPHRHGGKLY
jgi:NTP pyrophosphatase (non-canonical NTP hydrolase)